LYGSQVAGTVPLYRYLISRDGYFNHFYTTNIAEIGTGSSGQVGNHGYVSEGVAGYCYPQSGNGLTPLYRFYYGHNRLIDHFYKCTSSNTPGSYTFEGIACYVPNTESPTAVPTNSPTALPTDSPTALPTNLPTASPTDTPTASPTDSPSTPPTNPPTSVPTYAPTTTPTQSPTDYPTDIPTSVPSALPTSQPSNAPTIYPTDRPTRSPTRYPTYSPTFVPTKKPTKVPTKTPTDIPTGDPTYSPTFFPTKKPTKVPTKSPSDKPTREPTASATPFYRYYHSGVVDHFYTRNWNELGGGGNGWVYEGEECKLYGSQVAGTVPLYRYLISRDGYFNHFYTTNIAEIGTGSSGQVGNHGYVSEGVAGYCYPQSGNGLTPLYRFYYAHNRLIDHFYKCSNSNTPGSYTFEGIACYVPN